MKYLLAPYRNTILEIIEIFDIPDSDMHSLYMSTRILKADFDYHKGIIGRDRDYIRTCKEITREKNPEFFL